MFEILKFVVATALAIVAISVAITVAYRNRTIIKPALELSFRVFDDAYPSVPKKHKNNRPVAIFFHGKDGVNISGMIVPIKIKNRTSRKIGEVTVELTYPVAFFAANYEHIENLSVIADRFGEKDKADVEGQKKILAMRDAAELGGVARVRYNLGSVRSGDALSFGEFLKIPVGDEAFYDVRYENSAFKNVLGILKEKKEISALCHMTVSVFSDVTRRLDDQIDLVVCSDPLTESEQSAAKVYSDAYWLGKHPAGRRYFRPHLLMFERLRAPLIRPSWFDIIAVGMEARVSPERDGNVIVASRGDPFKSNYGVGWADMPGFDVRALPAEVDDVDRALRSIGFFRPPG